MSLQVEKTPITAPLLTAAAAAAAAGASFPAELTDESDRELEESDVEPYKPPDAPVRHVIQVWWGKDDGWHTTDAQTTTFHWHDGDGDKEGQCEVEWTGDESRRGQIVSTKWRMGTRSELLARDIEKVAQSRKRDSATEAVESSRKRRTLQDDLSLDEVQLSSDHSDSESESENDNTVARGNAITSLEEVHLSSAHSDSDTETENSATSRDGASECIDEELQAEEPNESNLLEEVLVESERHKSNPCQASKCKRLHGRSAPYANSYESEDEDEDEANEDNNSDSRAESDKMWEIKKIFGHGKIAGKIRFRVHWSNGEKTYDQCGDLLKEDAPRLFARYLNSSGLSKRNGRFAWAKTYEAPLIQNDNELLGFESKRWPNHLMQIISSRLSTKEQNQYEVYAAAVIIDTDRQGEEVVVLEGFASSNKGNGKLHAEEKLFRHLKSNIADTSEAIGKQDIKSRHMVMIVIHNMKEHKDCSSLCGSCTCALKSFHEDLGLDEAKLRVLRPYMMSKVGTRPIKPITAITNLANDLKMGETNDFFTKVKYGPCKVNGCSEDNVPAAERSGEIGKDVQDVIQSSPEEDDNGHISCCTRKHRHSHKEPEKTPSSCCCCCCCHPSSCC